MVRVQSCTLYETYTVFRVQNFPSSKIANSVFTCVNCEKVTFPVFIVTNETFYVKKELQFSVIFEKMAFCVIFISRNKIVNLFYSTE